ncbi:MAG: hypothetical protein GY795_27745 [Desulfobacterales bacterium]|nr:hypothetical protein [Desulfobacterales bacterium]
MVKKERKILIIIFSVSFLLYGGCGTFPFIPPSVEKDGKLYGVIKKKGWFGEELFRYRWWNHYERALSFAEGGFWNQAEYHLKEAIKQKPDDQWDARTYGMRYIDYFPHRELGIVFHYQAKKLEKDDIEKAKERLKNSVNKLERSLEYTPSAKAVLYLERTYQSLAIHNMVKRLKPRITLNELRFRDDSVVFSGNVKDNTYIKSISLNISDEETSYENTSEFQPIFILNSKTDLTRNYDFQTQLFISPNKIITVKAENIMGETKQETMLFSSINYGNILLAKNDFFVQDRENPLQFATNHNNHVPEIFHSNKLAILSLAFYDEPYETEDKWGIVFRHKLRQAIKESKINGTQIERFKIPALSAKDEEFLNESIMKPSELNREEITKKLHSIKARCFIHGKIVTGFIKDKKNNIFKKGVMVKARIYDTGKDRNRRLKTLEGDDIDRHPIDSYIEIDSADGDSDILKKAGKELAGKLRTAFPVGKGRIKSCNNQVKENICKVNNRITTNLSEKEKIKKNINLTIYNYNETECGKAWIYPKSPHAILYESNNVLIGDNVITE